MTCSRPRWPLRSHSMVHSEKILLFWNRTNSWCRSHMYISTYFPPLYVVLKIGLSTITYIFNIHLFSNVVIMTLNYVLYPILVQNSKKCSFWRFISSYPASTHSDKQQHHSRILPSYHLVTTKRQEFSRGQTVFVREIVNLI